MWDVWLVECRVWWSVGQQVQDVGCRVLGVEGRTCRVECRTQGVRVRE